MFLQIVEKPGWQGREQILGWKSLFLQLQGDFLTGLGMVPYVRIKAEFIENPLVALSNSK